MKNWTGTWLIAVAILHILTTIAGLHAPLQQLIDHGVFNTVGPGTDPLMGLAVWSLMFGGALLVCGLAIRALEKSSPAPLPKTIGWSLLALAVCGVIVMPASGFWLAFPPALRMASR